MRVKCQKYRGGGKDASEARNRNLHFAKQGYFSCIYPCGFYFIMIDFLGFSVLY